MENRVKLDESEIQKIMDIQQRANRLSMELGKIELSKLSLDKKKDQVVSMLPELEKDENLLMEILKSKYGNGTIDLETGEFVKQEESDN